MYLTKKLNDIQSLTYLKEKIFLVSQNEFLSIPGLDFYILHMMLAHLHV
jgi:hypothetical protein